MGASASPEVTGLLQAWGRGDEEALRKLMPLVYEQLHAAARRYMAGERPGHTLQTTALIHETYLRLVDIRKIQWQDRAHFFAMCAQLGGMIGLADYGYFRAGDNRARGFGHDPCDGSGGLLALQPTAEQYSTDEASPTECVSQEHARPHIFHG